MGEIGVCQGWLGRFVMDVSQNLTYVGVDPFLDGAGAQEAYLEQNPHMREAIAGGKELVTARWSEVARPCEGGVSEHLADMHREFGPAELDESCYILVPTRSGDAAEAFPDGS